MYHLPPDYQCPKVGEIDCVGYVSGEESDYCEANVKGYVCTLSRGHWCPFHVAHMENGEVLAVRRKRVPKWLKLPEGM